MRCIAVLGAGDLGAAVARQIAAADVCARVVLIDEAETVAQGKALDIRQAAPIDGYSTELRGTADRSLVVNASAIVFADTTANQEWQDDQGVRLLREAAAMNSGALLLCAGTRQAMMMERAVHEGGLNPARVIGSAPEALRSAISALVALEADCTPAEVSLTVLGRPPDHIIVPWDDASIAGRRATTVLSAPAVSRLDARLSRLWPPGPFTLASAATRFLRAAATRQPTRLSAFVVTSSDNGPRSRAAVLPITLRRGNSGEMLDPTVDGRDRVRLETALQR